MTPALVLTVAAAGLGLLTCRLALGWVRAWRVIDLPNERSSHTAPTPRGGGLGILLALGPVAAVAVWWTAPGLGPASVVVAGGATVILGATGFADDLRGLAPPAKLGGQLVAAVLLVLGTGVIDAVALPGTEVCLGVLAWPLTLFWVLGFSNGFNFMDGTDGIAAVHGGLAAGLFAAGSVIGGDGRLVWLAAPLCGSCLSFLSVNRPPAKVFMGDVSSLAIGALLAGLAILGNRSGEVPFVSGFLFLGPFLFDTLFTLFRRVLRGENLLRAHRSHLYQRLVIAGWSHGRVALLYGTWTLFTGGLGLLYPFLATGLRWTVLAAALASGAGVVALTLGLEGTREGTG